jgi:hypothetical protein
MKNIIFLVLTLLLLISPMTAFSHSESDEIKINLAKLVHLQKQSVHVYEGYRYTIHWVNNSPMIEILQQQVDVTNKKPNVTEILQVDSKYSPTGEDKSAEELLAFKNFKAQKYTQSGCDADFPDSENKQELVKFNAYDNEGRLRVSELRNSQNGFGVETIFYSENGKPLSMSFFHGLRINEGLSTIYPGPVFRMTLKEAEKKFGFFDHDDPTSVIKFCNRLLDSALNKK